MNKEEYLNNLNTVEILSSRIKDVETIYKCNLNEKLSKIISYADSVSFFDEERRALSYKEIIDPINNIDYDFIIRGLIPLIDAYDNSYIVFVIKENKWAKYNIYDEVLFKKKNSFEEVL